MTRFVVDASVAVKWLVQEPDSERAIELWRAHDFIAPDLLVAEVGNILWKKASRGEVPATDVAAYAQALGKTGVQLRSMTSLVAAAVSLAVKLNHPAYDCFYLVLAERESLGLVTADDRLRGKLVGSLFKVLSLEEALAA